MVIAQRKGVKARFSDAIWRTGIPSKNGWIPEETPDIKKEIPSDIIHMAEMRKSQVDKPKAGDPPPEKKVEGAGQLKGDVNDHKEVPEESTGWNKDNLPTSEDQIPDTEESLRELLSVMEVNAPPNYKVKGLTNLVKKHLGL